MSEYQRLKARALELQREKEYELKRELARKAEKEQKAAKEEAERRKRVEELTREARRKELMAANAALANNKSSQSKAANDGYDPFAEDAVAGPSKPPPRSTPKTSTKLSNGTTNTSNGARASSSGSGSTSRAGGRDSSAGGRGRKPSPPVLGRKEKAALKLQRASKSSKASVEDSLFSVRALVDGFDSRPGSGAGSGASSPRRAPTSRSSAPIAPRSGAAAKMIAAGAGSKSKSLAQMKKSVNVGELRALCPDRNSRDRRTLDEIQRDIKLRNAKPGSTGSGASTPRDRERDRDRDRDRIPASRPAGRPSDRDVRDPRDRIADRERERRRRQPSSSDSDSDSDDSRRGPPRKRNRGGSSGDSQFGEPSRSAVSAMIQDMFNRGRAHAHRPAPRDDYDSGSDMEAGLSDVEAEEKRALAIARREDLEAEKEENMRKEAKERAKRDRERKGR